MDISELKNIKIEVVNKSNKKLAPTNMLVARTLIARDKAIWIKKDKMIMLLQTKKEFKEFKNKIIAEENRICYICNIKIPNDERATIDHVYPKSKYGKDNRENLHCCCKRCNDDKGNMDIEQYYNHIKNNIEKYHYINIDNLYKLKTEYNLKKNNRRSSR